MADYLDDALNSVISRLAARTNSSAEEAARDQRTMQLARAAMEMTSEAHISSRADVGAEFDVVANETRRDTETIRQTAEQEQQSIDQKIGFANELIRNSADILNEHDNTRATLALGNPQDAFADVAGNSMSPKLYLESSSDGQQRTDDNGDTINVAICREDRSAPSKPRAGPSGSSSSGSLSLLTPRNSRRHSTRKIVVDSDDKIEASDSLTSDPRGDTREKTRPRRPLGHTVSHKRSGSLLSHRSARATRPMSHSTALRSRSNSPIMLNWDDDSKDDVKIHRRRSLVRPSASQVAVSSEVSGASVSSPASQGPSGERRRSARAFTPVHTYNVKRNFRNMVGSLEGPEHVLPAST
ncbi:hypothetical protein F5B17DRAFT_450674 [Nemania serpens]|nr:hypothetical protein F5B17DRAFT_450674 [Nemania serpens]